MTGVERRAPVQAELTPEAITELLRRIDAAEEKRYRERMETIGLDVSTPKARAEISADFAHLRGWRIGTGRAWYAVLGAGVLGILTVIGHWAVTGMLDALQSLARAKGAP